MWEGENKEKTVEILILLMLFYIDIGKIKHLSLELALVGLLQFNQNYTYVIQIENNFIEKEMKGFNTETKR